MKRYSRLLIAFWTNSLRQAVEFKTNFWTNVASNIGWMLALVTFIKLIFRNTDSVAGWSQPEMFILFGTYSMLRGLSDSLFYKNLSQMPTYIGSGEMDFILTKPVNSQFYVSVRYIQLEELGQSVAAVGSIAYGVSTMPKPLEITTFEVLAYLTLGILAMVLFYSLNMLLMTLSFWLVRLENLMVLADTVYGIARSPIDIWGVFGPLPKFILTYFLPLAFFATMPVRALLGAPPIPILLTATGLSALFFTSSVFFWNYATKNYSSASS
jgi:ABC-2 type transport system permease protein